MDSVTPPIAKVYLDFGTSQSVVRLSVEDARTKTATFRTIYWEGLLPQIDSQCCQIDRKNVEEDREGFDMLMGCQARRMAQLRGLPLLKYLKVICLVDGFLEDNREEVSENFDKILEGTQFPKKGDMPAGTDIGFLAQDVDKLRQGSDGEPPMPLVRLKKCVEFLAIDQQVFEMLRELGYTKQNDCSSVLKGLTIAIPGNIRPKLAFEYAKAVQSGLPRGFFSAVDLIEEPVAALLGHYLGSDERKSRLVQDGVYTTFDWGGSTADIGTYRLISLTPLQFDVFEDAQMSPNGSELMQANLKWYLYEIVQEVCQESSDWIKLRDLAWPELEVYFSKLLAGQDDKTTPFAYQHSSIARGRSYVFKEWTMNTGSDGKLFFPTALLKRVIEARSKEAYNLIQKHLKGVHKKIGDLRHSNPQIELKEVLVLGGVMSNHYLRTILRQHFDDPKSPLPLPSERITIQHPYEKQTVATGCLIYGTKQAHIDSPKIEFGIGIHQRLQYHADWLPAPNPNIPTLYNGLSKSVWFPQSSRMVYSLPLERHGARDALKSVISWTWKAPSEMKSVAPVDAPGFQWNLKDYFLHDAKKWRYLATAVILLPEDIAGMLRAGSSPDTTGISNEPGVNLGVEFSLRDGWNLHCKFHIPLAGHYNCAATECSIPVGQHKWEAQASLTINLIAHDGDASIQGITAIRDGTGELNEKIAFASSGHERQNFAAWNELAIMEEYEEEEKSESDEEDESMIDEDVPIIDVQMADLTIEDDRSEETAMDLS